MTFDLLLVAARKSPRAVGIAESLGGCLDTFLGAMLRSCALLDIHAAPEAQAQTDLVRLLAAQLALDEPARSAPGSSAWPVNGLAAPSLAARPATAPISRPAFR
jgi:hypothetical protein